MNYLPTNYLDKIKLKNCYLIALFQQTIHIEI